MLRMILLDVCFNIGIMQHIYYHNILKSNDIGSLFIHLQMPGI